MKKKIMALAICAVMSLSMSVTAFAANSPTQETAEDSQEVAALTVTGEGLQDMAVDATLQEKIDATNAELQGQGIEIVSQTTKDLVAAGTYTWTLDVSDAYIGKAVLVDHYHNGVWTRQICTISGSKTITASFADASPVVIRVTNKTAAELSKMGIVSNEKKASDGTTSEAKTTSKTGSSPKTGSSDLALILALIACVSGGALVSTKKVR